MTDEPLPGMPAPADSRPARKSKDGMTVSRIHTARLCEQCCLDIHTFGVAGAPYPMVARWRLTDTDLTVQRLCEAHKNERCA